MTIATSASRKILLYTEKRSWSDGVLGRENVVTIESRWIKNTLGRILTIRINFASEIPRDFVSSGYQLKFARLDTKELEYNFNFACSKSGRLCCVILPSFQYYLSGDSVGHL